MKVKAKKDAFKNAVDKDGKPTKRMVDIFTHQDIKQCGYDKGRWKIQDLLDGKEVDIPDPKTSTGIPLSFLKKVDKIKKGGK